MYNTDLPDRAELPTSRQLIRSTILAIAVAIALLVTIVLPSEYNIDPTGIGRILGLAEMGAIKKQLAEEAEQDRQQKLKKTENSKPQNSSHNTHGYDFSIVIARLLAVSPAMAQGSAETGKADEMTVKLDPGQGAEIKLVMKKGAKANFEWIVEGGKVNCDLHGDSDRESVQYEKLRGSKGSKGELTASFDGNHGWFWRNRGSAPVTVTIKANGAYSEMKRVL